MAAGVLAIVRSSLRLAAVNPNTAMHSNTLQMPAVHILWTRVCALVLSILSM